MRKAQLLSTAAVALLLTAGVAFAQDKKDEAAPARAPTAQQKAPAEKVAPPMKAGKEAQKSKHETTGQAPSKEPSSDMKKDEKSAPEKSSSDMKKPATTGQAPSSSQSEMKKDSASPKTEMNSKSEMNTNNAVKSEQKSGVNSSSKSAQSPSVSSTTTGQGAAAGAAKLSSQQRTKITTVFKQHKVAPAKLNISIRVGTRVPESVHFYPVPTQVVEIYPEWRGFDYIMVGDQILIIDPHSHEIIAILEV